LSFGRILFEFPKVAASEAGEMTDVDPSHFAFESDKARGAQQSFFVVIVVKATSAAAKNKVL
jgi:hypothetical protein